MYFSIFLKSIAFFLFKNTLLFFSKSDKLLPITLVLLLVISFLSLSIIFLTYFNPEKWFKLFLNVWLCLISCSFSVFNNLNLFIIWFLYLFLNNFCSIEIAFKIFKFKFWFLNFPIFIFSSSSNIEGRTFLFLVLFLFTEFVFVFFIKLTLICLSFLLLL